MVAQPRPDKKNLITWLSFNCPPCIYIWLYPFFMSKKHPRSKPLGLDILEKSTQLNRTGGVGLIFLLLLVLVPTAYVTDLNLVENRKVMDLPFMNGVTMLFPLVHFAYVAPVVIFFGHLIFLVSLREHALKLKAWIDGMGRNADTEALRKNLPFSMFNLAHINDEWTAAPARMMMYFAIFILPLVTLCYVQFRFSDIHNLLLAFFQFLVIVIDFVLVRRYYKNILGMFFSSKSISATRRPLLISLWALTFTAFGCLFIVFLIAGDNTYKSVAAYMKGERPGVILRLIYDREYHNSYDACFYKPLHYLIPIPRLEVTNKVINMNEPEDRNSKGQPTEAGKGRDFVFARFTGCDFVQPKLSGARMMSADLVDATFEKASFANINLEGSNMARTSLWNADLKLANLTRACLRDADLIGATLTRANLDHTDFSRAKLDYAHLNDETELSGDLMRGASMQGIDLRNAHIINLSLEGVDLKNANLEGAMIKHSNFQGADLRNANMNGAFMGWVKLQGADLSDCKLGGTLFTNCYVNAVNWPKGIEEATGTRFDITQKIYLEEYPSDSEIEKTHQLLKAINFKTNFVGQMRNAREHFAPRFGDHANKTGPLTEFTEERILVLDNCGARIDHLWLQEVRRSSLEHKYVVAHNRAITQHCLRYYPHLLVKLIKYDLNKYPGARPDSVIFKFAMQNATAFYSGQ